MTVAEHSSISLGPFAVLGAGTIGASWAALFLANGCDVRLWDPDPRADRRFAAGSPEQIETCRRTLALTAPVGRWTFAGSAAEAVAGTTFVQESGPESLGAKRSLYVDIGGSLAHDAVVASSTSSIMPTLLQDGCAFGGRLLIGHPFNPPHLIPLVEVVAGRQTADSAVNAAMAVYRRLGKYPIRLRTERPGHLANRLQAALWREAVDAVASGAASVADVDAAVTQALGPRWSIIGPHATFHLAGGRGGLQHFLAHLGPAFSELWDDLQPAELSPRTARALVAGIEEEFGGRATAVLARERDERLATLLQVTAPLARFDPEERP